MATLGIHLLVPQFNTQKTIQYLRQSINSMKADEDIFKALLKKQPYHDTSDCKSIIRFGNPESSLKLTVFSNPYCSPCSKMHKRLEKLLQQVENNISVQYILSSFGENLNSTNKYLFAACIADKTGSSMQILRDWYEKGKPLKDDYFKEMGLSIEHPDIEAEFAKHNAWKEKTKLRGTPTVLVNGYQLPESYKIEDLPYFTNLEL